MDMQSPQVSVIIPIYNVEKYLSECLDSVLAQTLESLEVICVNDGSTDGSLALLRKYESQDDRIIVIDKENGGYGKGVNCGLGRATGEWIAIVEPDDIIDAHMYEDLVKNAQLTDGGTADIVKSSYWLYFDLEDGLDPYVQLPALANCMRCYRYEFNVWEDSEVLRHHPSIWSAIYKRSFIEEQNIRMIEPKGAGWADNPWFFETMLQAERIVWTPAAYYKYRQTNPGASSVLKDYHLPFDRLRDIRAIYDRMGVTDKDLLTVLYQRSFNYMCNSLFDEFHFPENDPEFMALVHEVLDWMNPDIVLEKNNGIASLHKEYYRDVMGMKLQTVKECRAVEDPLISIVLPLKDDRRGLWRTLGGLMKQKFKDFEIICVDCCSNDRSPSIIAEVSKKDGRFRLVREESGNVGNGFNKGIDEAHGRLIAFMRAGVIITHADYLQKVADAAGTEMSRDADLFATSMEFGWARASRFDEDDDVAIIECSDKPEYVASNLEPEVYGKIFARERLVSSGIRFIEHGDEDGCAFGVSSMIGVTKVALLSNMEILWQARRVIARFWFEDEEDFLRFESDRFEAMASVAQKDGSDVAWRIARGCIIHALAKALNNKGLKYSDRAFYEMLRDTFENKYGLKRDDLPYYYNFHDYAVLQYAFSTSYERYRILENTSRRGHEERLENTLITSKRKFSASRDKIKAIENSGSYKVGKSISKVYKAIKPGKKA